MIASYPLNGSSPKSITFYVFDFFSSSKAGVVTVSTSYFARSLYDFVWGYCVSCILFVCQKLSFRYAWAHFLLEMFPDFQIFPLMSVNHIKTSEIIINHTFFHSPGR